MTYQHVAGTRGHYYCDQNSCLNITSAEWLEHIGWRSTADDRQHYCPEHASGADSLKACSPICLKVIAKNEKCTH